jgi:hypothetical protein
MKKENKEHKNIFVKLLIILFKSIHFFNFNFFSLFFSVPDIYIATDFICAFPTETGEDFDEL